MYVYGIFVRQMRVLLILLSLVTLQLSLKSQTVDNTSSSEGNKLFYRSELYGGVFMHTNGYGVNFRKSDRLTGYTKRIFAVDLLNLKHAKEFKSYNPYVEDNRGFVYGKLNSTFLLRPSIGYQKIWFTKDAKKGVQISYIIFGGPTAAFLKPIYLEVADFNGNSRFGVSKTEKFNPEKHTYDNIFGKAPFLKGIEETKVWPGLSAKFALNFDYATDDLLHRALETGVSVDAFIQELPIMAFETNRRVYFTLFINLHFGKKII